MQSHYIHKLNNSAHEVLKLLLTHGLTTIKTGDKFRLNLETKNGFKPLQTSFIEAKTNLDEIFVQEICEYLETKEHIKVKRITNDTSSAIQTIEANIKGYKAFRFEYYLELNYDSEFKEDLNKAIMQSAKSTHELNENTIPKQFLVTRKLAIASIIVSLAAITTSTIAIFLPKDKEIPLLLKTIVQQQKTKDSLLKENRLIYDSTKNVKPTSYTDSIDEDGK